MKNKKYVGIALFSGAGRLSLGAELAGIEVKYAIEKDKHVADTYQLGEVVDELSGKI